MFLENTFTHHVHFWLRSQHDKEKLIEGIKTLLPIVHIRDVHIGVPADTYRDVVERSYDVSMLLLFDDKAAHDAYQVDPIHEEFRRKYTKPLCKNIVVLDSVNIK